MSLSKTAMTLVVVFCSVARYFISPFRTVDGYLWYLGTWVPCNSFLGENQSDRFVLWNSANLETFYVGSVSFFRRPHPVRQFTLTSLKRTTKSVIGACKLLWNLRNDLRG